MGGRPGRRKPRIGFAGGSDRASLSTSAGQAKVVNRLHSPVAAHAGGCGRRAGARGPSSAVAHVASWGACAVAGPARGVPSPSHAARTRAAKRTRPAPRPRRRRRKPRPWRPALPLAQAEAVAAEAALCGGLATGLGTVARPGLGACLPGRRWAPSRRRQRRRRGRRTPRRVAPPKRRLPRSRLRLPR